MVIESACDFEYLENFRSIIQKNYPRLSENEQREKALELIEILLKKRLLDVCNIENDSKWDITIEEIMRRIDKIWVKGASYIDLISTVYFKRQEWFYKKLHSSGYNFTNNWVNYVSNNTWLRELLSID